MGDIVTLNAPANDDEAVPHAEGAARCLACQHEWRAVAPIGTTDLECPECGTVRGVWKYNFQPAGGEVWQCDCGASYFLLTRIGAPMCSGCGLRATGWVDA